MNQNYPSTKQANLLFLLVSIAILAGSSLLAPWLGIGTNLWINEYLWILAPAILLVKLGKMPAKEVFKFQKTSKDNIMLGFLAAIGMWFFSFYLSKLMGLFLDSSIGTINIEAAQSSPSAIQSVLLLIGMIVLAPICEELLFRGVIQSAYGANHKKYSFIFSAVLFGMFHVLNGITDVLPAFFIGLTLGYLVYRTGSIAASIVAHMTNNFCALFINGALRLSFLKTIPLWLHVVSIGGLLLAVFLLSRVKPADQEQVQPVETVNPAVRKYSVGSILLFALSGVYVILIGAVEIYARRTL